MTPIDPVVFASCMAANAAGRSQIKPRTLDEFIETRWDPDYWDARLFDELRCAKAASSGRTTTLDRDPQSSTMMVFPGSVEVNDHFTYNNHVLVLGDLTVKGTITAAPEHAVLMVLGDVTCRAAQFIRGYVVVGGDFAAQKCFHGCADGFAKVRGTVSAPLMLTEHWSNLDIADNATTRNIVTSRHADLRDSGTAAIELQSVLTPQALARCTRDSIAGKFDPFELFAMLNDYEPIFLRGFTS